MQLQTQKSEFSQKNTKYFEDLEWNNFFDIWDGMTMTLTLTLYHHGYIPDYIVPTYQLLPSEHSYSYSVICLEIWLNAVKPIRKKRIILFILYTSCVWTQYKMPQRPSMRRLLWTPYTADKLREVTAIKLSTIITHQWVKLFWVASL